MLEQLKPVDSPRIIDLVKTAGVDVSRWGISRRGRVEDPASNPAYCYEWAFVEESTVVVLNLWHDELAEVDGKVFDDVNPRRWADQNERPQIRKRASRFENAVSLRVPVHADHRFRSKPITDSGRGRSLYA
jgi:5-methylcytosine-specific restriction protein A